jgi:RHS repeat-associated protein
MDYMLARYYSAGMGRFTTVDPAMTLRKNLAEPQRWNRYSYALNNPIRYVDPDGRDIKNAATDPVIRDTATRLSNTPTIQRLYGKDSGNDLLILSINIPRSQGENEAGEAAIRIEPRSDGTINVTLMVDPLLNSGDPKPDADKKQQTQHEFGEASLAAQGIDPGGDDTKPTKEGERLEGEAAEQDKKKGGQSPGSAGRGGKSTSGASSATAHVNSRNAEFH